MTINKLLIALVWSTILLAGCVASGTPTTSGIKAKSMQVDPGMTKKQVIEIMGPPGQRSFKGNGEALTFFGVDQFQARSLFYVVWFNDGAVTAITNYESDCDYGDCSRAITPIDWGQAPADVKIKLDID